MARDPPMQTWPPPSANGELLPPLALVVTIILVTFLLTMPRLAQSSPEGDCLDTPSKKVKGARTVKSTSCSFILDGANAFIEGEGAVIAYRREIWLFKGILSVILTKKNALVIVNWNQQKFTVTGDKGNAVFTEYNDLGTKQKGLMIDQINGVTAMTPTIQFPGHQAIKSLVEGDWIGVIEPIIEKVYPPAPCQAYTRVSPIRVRFYDDGKSRLWEVAQNQKEEKCDFPIEPAATVPAPNMGCSCTINNNGSGSPLNEGIPFLGIVFYIFWLLRRRR